MEHSPPQGHDIKDPRLEKLADRLEQAIYSIRWLLAPMYLLLYVALAVYLIKFTGEIIHLGMTAHHITGQMMVLVVLELLDMVMIAQLVAMTTQGGYSIFVREFDYNALSRRPRWLSANFSSAEQKYKLGTSIMGILLVHLIKDAIGNEKGEVLVSWEDLNKKLAILGATTVVTGCFCIFNLWMHHSSLHHTSHETKEHHDNA